MLSREKNTLSGGRLSNTPNTENNCRFPVTKEQNQLVRVQSSISLAAISKGIGLKTAQKIVELYGENTIDEILEHPEKLETISGLSSKSREAFVSTLRLNYGTEMVLAKLANYGIPNKLAIQIQDTYKEETIDIVENYPYQLGRRQFKGLGFTIADQLAQELGIESQAPERFRAGLIHSLLNACMESGVYLC